MDKDAKGMSQQDEHTAFARFAAGLDSAADAARTIGLHRNDRRWETIADLISQLKNKAYEVTMSSAGVLKQ